MGYILDSLPEIKAGLQRLENQMLTQAVGFHPDLDAALSVILSSGGKRIRPTLILLIGSILKAEQEALVTLATSIELLHTATLVHDDLIDGSLLRRGIPTLNAKWSPAATVITGDFVFACAAFMASKTNSIEVMSLFSKTLMTIVNGEVTQLFDSRCSDNRKDYYKRIYAKTASLFETSTISTAIISNSDAATCEKMKLFGYNLGMAFQIVDDILDYSGDESTVGKPIGGDLRQGLITLPMLYYIESHPDDLLVQEMKKMNCIQDESKIAELVSAVSKSDCILLAMNDAKEFSDRAETHLSSLPDSPEKDALIQITRFTVERKK